MNQKKKNTQQPLRIAIQGERYAFSEIAARKFFGDAIEIVPCRAFDDVFASVSRAQADYGVLPIENSLTGSIHRAYDLLLSNDLSIVGEVVLRIEQHLIAHPGVALQDIRVIYSHPQALEQSRYFLTSLKNVEAIASYDTAGSVKMIRDKNLRDAAAIGSRWAAEDYGMQVLKAEIEDSPENYTRFYILSREPKVIGQANKTSILFSMKSIPGALFKSLSVFALRDIDLLRIESRPLRGRPWEYIFYLDFVGNMNQELCQNAIRHLQEITTQLKVLGSYAAATLNSTTR
ncbi:prephenate dehydratase [candidate division KSB1 bacterium]|nr:prephenate dehydratase [candidate division KSB1 bacterium]RQW08959.1 MAG: prephenate dehydratase [candidate division KSB1 bacterium]